MVMVLGELDYIRQQREQRSAFAKAAVSFDVDPSRKLSDVVSSLKINGRQGDAHKAVAKGFDGTSVPIEYRPYSVGDALAQGVDRLVVVEYTKRLTGSGREIRGLHIICPKGVGAEVAKIYDAQARKEDVIFSNMSAVSPSGYVMNLVGDNGIAMSGSPAGTILDVTVSVFQRAPFEAEIAGQPTRISWLNVVK